MKKIAFVVNPHAANGAAAKRWPAIAAQAKTLLGDFDTLFTERSGHAIELARQAAAGGAELVVSVGGDGTMNEVVNGLMAPNSVAVNPATALGQICIGTGGDFRKTTGLPKEPEAALTWLAGDKTLPLDIGRLDMFDLQDREIVRYFVNIASFGIGGDLDARVNRTTKIFGGFASFAWGSLVSMLGYKNQPVRLRLDDVDLGERVIFTVAAANGQYFGGGMHPAPNASPYDGWFDVVIMGDIRLVERFATMPKIYKAEHIHHPKVEVRRAKKIVATSAETVLFDVDGETPGRLPATITLLPGALKLKVKD
jgi:YegS/Rv2252/BmrU family lipid kinase